MITLLEQQKVRNGLEQNQAQGRKPRDPCALRDHAIEIEQKLSMQFQLKQPNDWA